MRHATAMSGYFAVSAVVLVVALLAAAVAGSHHDAQLCSAGADRGSGSLSSMDIAICGEFAAGGWLWQYVVPRVAAINDVLTPLASVGMASYGVMEVGGRYFAYELATDAVKGIVYIPPNISVLGYWPNGEYYGRAFSVQLNAFVIARLRDGMIQYYLVQNFIVFDERRFEGLKAVSNVWNVTAKIPILGASDMRLTPAAVRGGGAVYVCPFCRGVGLYYYEAPDTTPLGRVELETWVHADNGEIIVEFYANGQMYDKVVITPYVPATSAHIVIAPATTPTGHPLNIELVFGGYNAIIPYAVLKAGRIGLELYVRANNSWTPPPSAWSVGYATVEAAYAHVVPQGAGSVVVEPGPPNPRQLWAGTVIVTPFGVDMTTSTDLSRYIEFQPERVNLGNNAWLVLAGVYVNGRPVQSLSYVPLGSLVEFRYTCQTRCNITTIPDGKGIVFAMGVALAFAIAVKRLRSEKFLNIVFHYDHEKQKSNYGRAEI